jgi:hypothetical protein
MMSLISTNITLYGCTHGHHCNRVDYNIYLEHGGLVEYSAQTYLQGDHDSKV